MTKRWKIALLVGVALVGAFALWQFQLPEEGPFAGNRLPDFSLMNQEGTLTTRADLAGRPLLINFWATWCEPCREEMPVIEALYRESAGAFEVVAVTDEPLTMAQRFFDELELTLPLFIDVDRSVHETFLVHYMPTSFFVNPNGVIESIWIGQIDRDRLISHLNGIVPKEAQRWAPPTS